MPRGIRCSRHIHARQDHTILAKPNDSIWHIQSQNNFALSNLYIRHL